MEGKIIGKFRMVRLIGSGGMGAVYEAVHQNLRKHAAIKVLHQRFAQDPELASRFNSEAHTLTSLDHPGVVQIFDHGTVDGVPYIVMEYLKGETLAERLVRHPAGVLPVSMCLRLCRQVATALATVHQHRVVHRDLKPANVMIVSDPEAIAEERTKLFDFGIAKILGPQVQLAAEQEFSRVETRVGVLVGTPTYMSPEQCRGDGPVDGRSDVYSLGIMLYEMLSGLRPFRAADNVQLLSMHQNTAPTPLRHVANHISVQIEALVMWLLSKRPEQRPSMGEVAQSLKYLSERSMTSSQIPVVSVSAPTTSPLPSGGGRIRSPLRETKDKGSGYQDQPLSPKVSRSPQAPREVLRTMEVDDIQKVARTSEVPKAGNPEPGLEFQNPLLDSEDVEGFLGSALVDIGSGRCLCVHGSVSQFNMNVAATHGATILRAKRQVLKSLSLDDEICDIVITLERQYFIIRPVKMQVHLFLYLILDRDRAVLALASYCLAAIEARISGHRIEDVVVASVPG